MRRRYSDMYEEIYLTFPLMSFLMNTSHVGQYQCRLPFSCTHKLQSRIRKEKQTHPSHSLQFFNAPAGVDTSPDTEPRKEAATRSLIIILQIYPFRWFVLMHFRRYHNWRSSKAKNKSGQRFVQFAHLAKKWPCV